MAVGRPTPPPPPPPPSRVTTRAAALPPTVVGAAAGGGRERGAGSRVPGVDLVLIVGVPPSADHFLHLAGRTARNGAAGRAVVVGTPDDGRKLAALGPQLDIDLAAQTSHLAERDERLADTWRVHSKKYEQ